MKLKSKLVLWYRKVRYNTIISKSKFKIRQLYKKLRYFKESVTPAVSPTVCAVPWMHLNFEPDGKVFPCCLTSTHNYHSGDLNTQTVEEIWNSSNQRALRRDMIAGREPEICRKCFDKERVTGESGRVHHNREFKHVLDAIPKITKPDGTCTTMELKYWDFRFSNLCNMKCRSCGPRCSSAWIPDAKKLGWLKEDKKVYKIGSVEDQSNYDFIKDQIHNAEKIYFAGGEPLIMPEHWQTLDILVEHGKFDVKLSYNTNCSTLEYGKKNVVDYWRQWNPGCVDVWPSIDEFGPRAELIRAGTVWHQVEENLITLANTENIYLRPGITVGAWNVFRLPELLEHLISLGVIKPEHFHLNFFFNLLEEPKHYHISILPDEFRHSTIQKLEDYFKEFESKYRMDVRPKFTQIMHELNKPFNAGAAKKFLLVSEQVDGVRSENIFDVIPELLAVKKAIDGTH